MHDPLPVAPVQNIKQRPCHTGEGRGDCNQYAQMADTSSFGRVVFPSLICSKGLGRTGRDCWAQNYWEARGGSRKQSRAGGDKAGDGDFQAPMVRAYFMGQIGCLLSNV